MLGFGCQVTLTQPPRGTQPHDCPAPHTLAHELTACPGGLALGAHARTRPLCPFLPEPVPFMPSNVPPRTFIFTPDAPNLFQPAEVISAGLVAHVQAFRQSRGLPPRDAVDIVPIKRIADRRARKLTEARQHRAGLPQRSESGKALAEALRRPIQIAGITSEHAADQIGATLFEELPWLRTAIEPVWRDLRDAAREGRGLHFRPVLLDGPPGVGKSFLAGRLAELAGLPWTSIDLGATSEGFPIAGTERTWGTATPGRPMQTILSHRIANPLIFVDELDKGGVIHSSRGQPTSGHNALLALLEPETARRWPCPYFGLRFDMSHVNWILAANRTDSLPAPLRSRLRILPVRGPNRAELRAFAARALRRRDLPEDALDGLDRLFAVFPPDDPRLDLRRVLRLIDDLAQIGRDAPILN
jgi:hypothetical protein